MLQWDWLFSLKYPILLQQEKKYLNGTIPEATNLILDLRENYDIFCSMVVYPVVPKGIIMLRLIPTAVHTLEDVNYTIETFKIIKENLIAGKYQSDKIVTSLS